MAATAGTIHPELLTEDQILRALARLSDELGNRGIDGEVCLFGGAAMNVPDIQTLIQHLKLTSADAVFEILTRYYPADRLSPKTQFLIEDLFDAR